MHIHTIFDIIVILGLSAFAAYGARRGMIEEVLGLTGWIVGILIALHFMNFVGTKLSAIARGKMGPEIFKILGFIIILIVVRMAFQAFTSSFQRVFSPEIVSKANKIGGAFFGFFKGALFISVLTLAISLINFGNKMQSIEDNSILFRHMTRFAPAVLGVVKDFVPQSQLAIDKVMDTIDNNDIDQNYDKQTPNSSKETQK